MKKMLIIFIILIFIYTPIFATDIEILESQKDSLGISEFIEMSKKYIQNDFEVLEINNIFEEAITGRIGNKNIVNSILNILGRETKTALCNIGIIMIVIIIHSILVTISESLGNKSVSQIAYFVEYIIIITLVLNNFSEIINMIKETINDLVGFSNCLIPLLITLMLTTGAIVSTGIIKPILLLLINFIGNFISNFILPLVIIGTALSILSKVSNKVRIDKLAKCMKSVSVWLLGIIMTLFVTVLSLESSITETVDRGNSKNSESSSINSDPCSRQNTWRCNRCSYRMCWHIKKCSWFYRNNSNCWNLYSTYYKISFVKFYILYCISGMSTNSR